MGNRLEKLSGGTTRRETNDAFCEAIDPREGWGIRTRRGGVQQCLLVFGLFFSNSRVREDSLKYVR